MTNLDRINVMLEDIDSAANIAKELGLKEVALSLFGIASIVVVSKDNNLAGAKLMIKTAEYFQSIAKDILQNVK